MPTELKLELQDLLKDTELVNLSLRKFCICLNKTETEPRIGRFYDSPEYHHLCRKYKVENMVEYHLAYANEEAIAALIYKQKLLRYPDGLGIQG